MEPGRPAVLIFAGLDPSGGAGIAADILAVTAQGAHALPIVTALTVQDNDRVFDAVAIDSALLQRQAQALIDKIEVKAVKIGIPGSRANAQVIADIILHLRRQRPDLPVVLDPVLASGNGDALSRDDALLALAPLLPLVTLIVPNLPEARALSISLNISSMTLEHQARSLHARGCQHVLITGGHGEGETVLNRWFHPSAQQDWSWPRLAGEFHGSGCTLAAAIAARLAQSETMALALANAQAYCHRALAQSYAIAPGQRIPLRY